MPSQTLTDEVRQAIAATDRLFVETFNSGDPGGAAAAVYTSDALALPPGAEMIRGRQPIADFWRAAAEQMNMERVELSTVELANAGELVNQVGKAAITLAGGHRLACKYVVVWKEEDGRWKWHVDIWNTDQ